VLNRLLATSNFFKAAFPLKVRIPAPMTDVKGKPFGAERIIVQPIQLLLLHLPALSTSDSANLHFQINAQVSTGQVPNPASFPVVADTMDAATAVTNSFFPLRMRPMSQARGSPRMQDKVRSAEKPGKRYGSQSRLCFRSKNP